MQGNHVETIKKVLAEPAISQHLLQILIRCRHQAEIGSNDGIAPDPLKLLLLQNTQQFGLHLDGKVPNFIQKYGPPMRQLKFPRFPGSPSSGECPFVITEELRFEKVFGNGGTIDTDKRIDVAGAGMVNRLCEKLLPCPAFPGDQHGKLVGSGL